MIVNFTGVVILSASLFVAANKFTAQIDPVPATDLQNIPDSGSARQGL